MDNLKTDADNDKIKRFWYGDDISEIGKVTPPSIPIHVDEYKVVFKCIDPKDLFFPIND